MDLVSLGKLTTNDHKAQYQLVKFNKALKLDDFQNARDALVKAFEYDSASTDVQENDGILKFSEKKYIDSGAIFRKLYQKTQMGRHLYYATLNYAYILKSMPPENFKIDRTELESQFQMISKHIESRVDFSKELLLLQIYLLKKAVVLDTGIEQSAQQMMSEMPFQFTQYFLGECIPGSDRSEAYK